MKKKIMLLGMVLGLSAGAAWADDHGASAGTGYNGDRASACSMAKTSADLGKPWNADITGHSSCDCSQTSNGWWTCTVDAYWEKRK